MTYGGFLTYSIEETDITNDNSSDRKHNASQKGSGKICDALQQLNQKNWKHLELASLAFDPPTMSLSDEQLLQPVFKRRLRI